MSNSMVHLQHPEATNANGLPVVNRPCPPWCELTTGHEWDDEDLYGLVDLRNHELTIGTVDDVGVSIYNVESSTVGDASTFTPTTVLVLARHGDADLTPWQARQLADLLVLAADRVEAL